MNRSCLPKVVFRQAGVRKIRRKRMKFKILRQTSDKIQKRYGSSGRRTVHITGVSSTLNLLLGLGKVISGVLHCRCLPA